MIGFGGVCPDCDDINHALVATNVKFSIEDPHTDEPAVEAEHDGPTIVASPGHVMVVYRGRKDPITVGDGQILSLCEGDVVRVLSKLGDDDAKAGAE